MHNRINSHIQLNTITTNNRHNLINKKHADHQLVAMRIVQQCVCTITTALFAIYLI